MIQENIAIRLNANNIINDKRATLIKDKVNYITSLIKKKLINY